MSVMDKLKKNSKIKFTKELNKSEFFTEKDMVSTDVPMVNVALSGDPDGGLTSGLTVLAGPSKHFKTSFALLMAAAYLKEHEDAVLLFYDSEFGSPQSYFEAFGIDTSRVLHTPIVDVEQLKFDLVSQLDNIDRGDKVVIVIDSIGNLASKKELEDALNEKSVADMSRAKALKGLFRMVTPYLTMKNIPLLAVNHTYQEIGLFPKAIVSGGTGIYYSADNIWILGRQQVKKGTEVKGYNFVINVEKSRFVKEKSKVPISCSWEGGIEPYSGLLDVALAGGYVTKPSMGWYAKVDHATGEMIDPKVREKDTLTKEFWDPIFKETDFKKFLKSYYQIGHKPLLDIELDVEGEDE
ncbi:MAG: recombinase RecA [Crocinitomicaceae bacterium]|nr:recombinase RecA [Crocinitomicaceae bacterium]|tara:strand:- start:3675 stop:4730 length:1056 start_codon:yes stop_codon:yes gene_type:complete